MGQWDILSSLMHKKKVNLNQKMKFHSLEKMTAVMNLNFRLLLKCSREDKF